MGASVDLPQGFSFESEDESALPEGFEVDTKEIKDPYKTPWDVDEIDLDTLKNMSISERMQFAKDLNVERQAREASGIPKGLASGLTFGLSENIPGMTPGEGDLGFEGARIGAELAPITGLIKLWGIPYRTLQNSPMLKGAAQSVGRVLQMSSAGASEEALKEAFKGEIPDIEKIAEKGAEWGALDILFQVGGKMGRAVKQLYRKMNPKEAYNASRNIIDKFTKSGIDEDNVVSKANEAVKDVFSELSSPEVVDSLGERSVKAGAKPKSLDVEIPVREVNSRNMRNRKVEQDFYDRKRDLPEQPERPDIETPDEMIVDEEYLNHHSERPETRKKLGEDVVDSIDSELKAIEEEYTPYYELAQEQMQFAEGDTNNLVNKIFQRVERLRGRGMNLQPAEYTKVEGILTDAMKDLGVAASEVSDTGVIESIAGSEGPQSLDKMMEVYRRLGHHANYDALDKSSVDLITKTRNELKALIKESLKGENPEAFEMLETADRIFEDKSKRFGNGFIRRIRAGKTRPETISSAVEQPSNLEAIRDTVSPEVYEQVERELLSNLNDMNYKTAKSRYRELKEYFSEDAKNLADDILLSKKPKEKLSASDKKAKTENWIMKQMNKETKPTELLGEWQTPRGRVKIERALEGNPNKEEIIQFLKDESLYDTSRSIVSDSGKINFSKVEDLSAKSRRVIRDEGGESAVKFVEDLDKIQKRTKNITDRFNKMKDQSAMKLKEGRAVPKGSEKGKEILQKNKALNDINKKAAMLRNLKSQDYTAERGNEIIENVKSRVKEAKFPVSARVEDFVENVSSDTKKLLATLGLFTVGPVKTAAGVLTTKAGSKQIFNAIRNPRIRLAIKELSKTDPANPYQLYSSLVFLDEVVNEQDQSQSSK